MKESLRVLYVEDEDSAREGLTSLSSMMGHEVYSASNGVEGYEEFLKTKPHVVVSDVVMPLMNGLEMAKKIKEIDPSANIILVTAFSEKHLLLGAMQIGINGFLTKPLEVSKLAAKIDMIEELINLEPSDPKRKLLNEQLKSEALDDFISICV